jgi:phage gpG-like protein
MTMTNAGRFSAVARELARLPSRVSAAVARDIGREIQRNFDRGVDPYGKTWEALADSTIERGRHPPPLTDTGRGRASVKVVAAAGAGIRITVGVTYMLYHQFGGPSHLRHRGSYRLRRLHKDFGRDRDRGGERGNPPKRSFLPFDRIPDAWGAIVLAHLEAQVKRVIRA